VTATGIAINVSTTADASSGISRLASDAPGPSSTGQRYVPTALAATMPMIHIAGTATL